MTKIYCCGTIPWDMDPSNDGDVSFYMTPEACSDSEPCTDSCGVVEAEIVLGDHVIGMLETTKKGAKTGDEVLAEETVRQVLVDKLEKLIADSGDSEELVRHALTWMLAGRKRVQREARGEARRQRAEVKLRSAPVAPVEACSNSLVPLMQVGVCVTAAPSARGDGGATAGGCPRLRKGWRRTPVAVAVSLFFQTNHSFAQCTQRVFASGVVLGALMSGLKQGFENENIRHLRRRDHLAPRLRLSRQRPPVRAADRRLRLPPGRTRRRRYGRIDGQVPVLWGFAFARSLQEGDRFVFATADRHVLGIVENGAIRVMKKAVFVERDADGKPVGVE